MSPRTTEQNALVREESRARILGAGLELFAQHGFEQTSIRMIAAQAGISQGLLYNYFSSKHDLLGALFAQSIGDVHESFAPPPASANPHAAMEHFIRSSFAILRRNLRFWKLSYHVRMQPAVLDTLAPQLADWTAAIRRELTARLTALQVRDPTTEAEILFALIDGISQHYALEPERYPLDAVIDAVVAKYQGLTDD